MFTLFTSGRPWLDKQNNVLKFSSQEEAHRYAERVDGQNYDQYSIGIGEVGLFIHGMEHPKYVIRHL